MLFFLSLLIFVVSASEARGKMEPLISHLKEANVLKSPNIMEAMASVDRAEFCQDGPYFDKPSYIGFNATISAPHMHAFALETSQARLKDGAKVLDVGSGSGYLSVCLAELVKPHGRVVGLEHIEGLVEASIQNTKKSHGALLDSGCLEYVVGDGRLGWPQDAPYDVIHVGAACPSVPQPLLDQLAPGGIMIIPVGTGNQAMKVITKDAKGTVSERNELPVRYVPLTDKKIQLNKPV